jgi:OFA family oxalate/formate antiporter-like MFS transporter
MLWLMFTLSAGAGLTIIGFLKNLAAACFENAHQFTKESAGLEGAIVVSVFAIFNGVGRIFAGWLSDRIGRTRAMFLFFGLQAVLVSTLISTTTASPLVVYVVMALVGMCFGSNFALFPSATADFFGTKNVGVNYGMMFTAYGVGGLLGPTMFANMLPEKPVFGDYSLPLLIIGVLVGVAAIMAFLTKPPEQTKG